MTQKISIGIKNFFGMLFQKFSALSLPRKIISLLVIFSLTVPLFLPWQSVTVFGAPKGEEKFLAVVLVEQKIYAQIPEKITRYAKDIQISHKNLQSIVIPVPKTSSSGEIFQLLEKLYLEGMPQGREKFFLSGVVLVGDVPLPRISTPVGKIPSVFPYTDFEHNTFLWELEDNAWIKNPRSNSPEAEIWHGVIPGNIDELSIFFDKNHTIHTQIEQGIMPADEKVLLLDFAQEHKNLNSQFLNQYEQRSKLMGEMKNFRFNSNLLQSVMGTMFSEENFSRPTIDTTWFPKGEKNFWTDGGFDSFQNSEINQNIPDRNAKDSIEKFLPSYGEMTQKFESDIRDLVKNTGRWDGAQSQSIPRLITALDEYAANGIQEINKKSFDAAYNLAKVWDGGVLVVEEGKVKLKNLFGDDDGVQFYKAQNYKNGEKFENINTVPECSLYRGTFANDDQYSQDAENSDLYLADPISGVPSVEVEFNSLYDALSLHNGNVMDQCKDKGQCCAVNISQPGKCDPKKAITPIFSWAGGKKISNTSQIRYDKGFETQPKACEVFNFHTLSAGGDTQYISFDTVWGSIKNKIRKISSISLHNNPSLTGENTLKKVLGNPLSQVIPVNRTPYIDLQTGKPGNRKYIKLVPPDFFRYKAKGDKDANTTKSELLKMATGADEKMLAQNGESMDGKEKISYKTLNYPPKPIYGTVLDDDGNSKESVIGYTCGENFSPKPFKITYDGFYTDQLVVHNECERVYRVQKNSPGTDVSTLALTTKVIDSYSAEYLDFIFQWKDASPEQKHDLAMKIFLDTNNPLLADQKEKKYAYAHLGLSGNGDIIWDGPKSPLDGINTGSDNDSESESKNNAGDESTQESENSCGPIDGVPLWEWIPAVLCWLEKEVKGMKIETTKQCSLQNPNSDQDEESLSAHILSDASGRFNPQDILDEYDFEKNFPAENIQTTPAMSPLILGKKTDVNISFLGGNGKIARGEYIDFTLDIDGGKISSGISDRRSDIDGYQISTANGVKNISIIPTSKTVTISVSADLSGKSVSKEFSFSAVEKEKISLQFDSHQTHNNLGVRAYVLSVSPKYSGKDIENFSEKIYLKLSDPSRSFLSQESVSAGEKFTVALRSQENITVSATVRGMPSSEYTLKPSSQDILGGVSEIYISQVPETLDFFSKYTGKIEIFDTLGVPFQKKFTEKISVEVKNISPDIASAQVENRDGQWNFSLQTKGKKGIYRGEIIIQDFFSKKDLYTQQISFPVSAVTSRSDFENFSIPALYTSILGLSNYGDPRNIADHIGEKLLHNSPLLTAVTTQIVPSEVSSPSALITGKGAIKIFDESVTPFISSTSPLQISILDESNIRFLGEFSYIPAWSGIVGLRSPKSNESGVFIENFEETRTLTVTRNDNGAEFSLDTQVVARVLKNGAIDILDNAFSVVVEETQDKGFSLLLQYDDTPLSRITFLGGHFEPLYTSSKIQNGYEKNDYLLFSNLQEKEKIILFPEFQSDFTKNAFGVGFQSREKYVLQYAAGNSVGESTKSTAGIFLINFGDPSVRLPHAQENANGFDNTVGTEIFSRERGDIREVFPLDLDGDGSPDLATILQSGEILFSTQQGAGNFKDWSEGIKIDAKYKMIGVVDTNQDGYEDLLYSDENGKIHLLVNTNGVFTEDLHFLENLSLFSGMVQDFDNDGVVDIVGLNQRGEVIVMYGNKNGKFLNTTVIDSFDFAIPKGDISSTLLLSFPGIEKVPGVKNILQSMYYFSSPKYSSQVRDSENFDNKVDIASGVREVFAESITQNFTQGTEEKKFAPFPIFTSAFSSSSKKIKLLEPTKTSRGKRIQVDIEFTGNTDTPLELTIADQYSTLLDIDVASVQCENCGEKFSGVQTPSEANLLLFENIIAKKGESVKISYQAEIIHFPELEFSATNLNNDTITDIIFSRKGESDLGIKKFVSVSPREYTLYNAKDAPQKTEGLPDIRDDDKNGVPDIYEKDSDGNTIPDFADRLLNNFSSDSDADGIPDSWDDIEGDNDTDAIAELGEKLDTVIDLLASCHGGGCLNMPINYAFLVPGQPNLITPLLSAVGLPSGSSGSGGATSSNKLMAAAQALDGKIAAVTGKLSKGLGNILDKIGLPVGFQPFVMTIFATGPYATCVGRACMSHSTPPHPVPYSFGFSQSLTRFYLSPTLTGGVGVVICKGATVYPTGLPTPGCFIQAIPSDWLSFCKKLLGDPKKSSKSSLSGNGQIFQVESSYSMGSGENLMTISLDRIDSTIPGSNNNRVNGGPGFFARWANRQIEEFSAMLTLPSLTIYFPDIKSAFYGNDGKFDGLASGFVHTENFTNAKNDFVNHIKGKSSTARNAVNNSTGGEKTPVTAKNSQSLSEKIQSGISKGKNGVNAVYDKMAPAKKYLEGAQYRAKSIDDFYRMLESVPLIQIERQPIIIRIPTLSRKELLARLSDVDTWIADAEAEISAFKENTTGEIPETLRQQKAEILRSAKQALQDVKNLKKFLKFYLNVLPDLIANLDGQISQYIYSLLCYLEAITDITGGWLLRNKVRYEKWRELFATLPKIMKQFQALPKIFNNYSNYCSTCRAGNYDSTSFIINVIGSIFPEPPIIKFPRLPDIVLDFSQINAAIVVQVPDITFEPVRLNIPQIPKLQLPRANFSAMNLDIQIPTIPKLPSFEFPELPPFPGIELPKLPNLPPPPKIPDILGDISDLLSLIEKGLYIYCLIKKGIFVYPENTAMATVEGLTARPINPLSMDFLSKNYPNFQLPNISEIEVATQLNLEKNLDQLSKPFQKFADTVNEKTTNFWPDLNNTGLKFLDQSDAFDTLNEKENTAAQKGEEKINSGINQTLQDIAKPVQNTIEDVNNTIKDTVDGAGEIIEDTANEAIKPVNNGAKIFNTGVEDSVDAVNEVKKEIIDKPLSLRHSRIYFSSDSEENKYLESQYAIDENTLSSQDLKAQKIFSDLAPKILDVQEEKEKFSEPTKFIDVSVIREQLGLPKWKPSKPKKNTIYAPLQKELLALQKDSKTRQEKILAGYDISGFLRSDSGGIFTAQENEFAIPDSYTTENLVQNLEETLPKTLNPKEGIFLKTDTGIFPLMAYNDEFSTFHSFFFLDIDNDGDEDIVYSSRYEVFIKENFSRPVQKNILTNDIAVKDFSDMLGNFQSPKNLSATELGEKISLSVRMERYEDVDGLVYKIENAPTGFVRGNGTEYKSYLQVKKNIFDQLAKKYPTEKEFIPENNEISLSGKIWKFRPGEKIFIQKFDTQALHFGIDPFTQYLVRAQWILPSGKASTLSDHILIGNISPNDSNAPLSIGDFQKTGYLYKKNRIALSSTLDLENPNLDIAWDSDKNGSFESVGKSIETKIFREPSVEQIPIQISDLFENSTKSLVNVEYISPDVHLSSVKKEGITGFISPRYAGAPVSLLRDRYGITKKIVTSSADNTGRYITDTQGKFLAKNLDLSPNGIVKDNAGKIIAELLASNGKLVSRDENYSVKIIFGNTKFPLRQVLVNAENTIVANAIIRTSAENTVQISTENFPIPENIFAGTYALDVDSTDNFSIGQIALGAKNHAGGAIMYDSKKEKPMLLITRSGNIQPFENTNFSITREKNQEEENFILNIFEGKGDTKRKIFQVLESVEKKSIDIDFTTVQGGKVAFISPPPPSSIDNDSLLGEKQQRKIISYTPTIPKVASLDATVGLKNSLKNTLENTALPFSDVSKNSKYYDSLAELYSRNLISGYADGTFQPEKKISRAEFVQIALGVTECLDCISPSEKEKKRFYSPFSFPDVRPSDWFDFCIAKAKKLSMVMGYADGNFKPNDSITRAEAVAILLRQADIQMQNIPTAPMGDVQSDAWYYSAMVTGLNLGLVESNYGFTFPEEEITRGEFAQMAAVLFSIRDCTAVDSDGDGIPDYIEIYNGFDENDSSDGRLQNLGGKNPRDEALTPVPVGNEKLKIENEKLDSGNSSDSGDEKNTEENTEKNNDSGLQPEDNGDLCPFLPEDYDGIDDTDGCPELDIFSENSDKKSIGDSNTGEEKITLFAGDPKICGFLDYRAQVREGDIIWAAILRDDNSEIFSKSERISIPVGWGNYTQLFK